MTGRDSVGFRFSTRNTFGRTAASIGPAPPTGLMAVGGDGQVSLTWNAPAADGGPAVTGYDLYEGTSSGGEASVPVNPAPVPGTSYTVGSLTNGTTYYFTVTSVSADAQSVPSSESSATPAAVVTGPGAPTGLMAVGGDGQVSLTWNAPAADGGPAVTGYDLYEGTSSGGEASVPVNPAPVPGTSYTVGSLTNGTTYYFTVTSVSADAQSVPSSESSATPAAVVTGPGAPTGLMAVGGDGQVSLTWNAPAADGGPAVTGYDLYEGTSSGGEASVPVNPAPVPGTSYTVGSLTNGTTYYFTVTSVSADAQSVPSSESSATPAAVVTGPGAPTGLMAVGGDGQVSLTWNAPAADGGPAVTGYDLYEGTSSGGEASVPVNPAPVSGTSYTVGSLTNGTTYYFTVTSVSADAQSVPSSESSATPAAVITPPPAGSRALPRQIILLAAVLVIAAAAIALAIRRRRRIRLRSTPTALPNVRAERHSGSPALVTVHATGTEPTHTVHIEPDSGSRITTIEEVRP